MRIAVSLVILLLQFTSARPATIGRSFAAPRRRRRRAAVCRCAGAKRRTSVETAIHGRGWSSPVVWGNQIWVTTATEDGHEQYAVRVDRDTGKVLHDIHVFHNDKPRSSIR